jgi:sugar lactone lactonase YvrE
MKPNFAMAALLLLGACARKEAAPAADTTAAVAPPTGPTRVSTTEGFSTPESVLWDSELAVWYVSNTNGGQTAKDNNGFISRLTRDGAIDSLHFIQGGRDGATLNGPKGLALVGDTIWAADIDAVRGFNRRTGAPIATIEFGKQAKFLNDVAVGPNGVLYITDTGVHITPKGPEHPGPDRIYTLTGRLVAVAADGAFLSGPNGITWDATAGRFIVVPFLGTTVLGWKPGETTVDTLGTGPGQFDGVEIVDGKLLTSSWTDSTIDLVEGGTITRLISGVASPADFGADQTRSLIAIPIFTGNKVEFWRVK